MNHLLIGHADKTEQFLQIAKGGFLLIDDGPIADAFVEHFPRAVQFDVHTDSFNPLDNLDYHAARNFAALLYGLSPQGENTLTVRNGRRALVKLLLTKPRRLDRLPRSVEPADLEALGMVDELLLSPVLRKILCSASNRSFSYRPLRKVIAKIDRAALGEFDALVIATLLISQFAGPVVIPDFGFYGRDFHTNLVWQDRLTAGLNSLSEVTARLQQALLTIGDKHGSRCTWEDALTLARYDGHVPGTVAHTEFVHRAML